MTTILEHEETLDHEDIQGLVARGFGSLEHARFLLLQVDQPELARRYLMTLCEPGRVNTVQSHEETFALQIAFTAPGLRALEVPDTAIQTFSREFLEGMDDEVRAESLGDRDHNASRHWTWGRKGHSDIHVLLMFYAKDEPTLTTRIREERRLLEAGAFRVVHEKDTRTLDNHREHFGWRDGLSMPKIEGIKLGRTGKEQQTWTRAIRPGEFVLGYLNEYDCYNESPTAEPVDDRSDHLPATPDRLHKDLGRNGTYLVYRELTQDVHGLWRYLADHTREPGANLDEQAIALGAKMVGRWPHGAPLATSKTDDPDHAIDNEFLYSPDPYGLQCPIGAHVRRANPRDALAPDRDAADSMVMVRKHQLLRRGRPFGPPVSAKMDLHEVLAARGAPDGVPRGLHFICLVGHISRQFEFVQRQWIQSANFNALFKDGDPIVAARRKGDNANDEFTCPAQPVRRKYKAMPQFTTLVGGAYFFLPGLRALKFIARHP